MKFWISKYALTMGIYEIEAPVSEHGDDRRYASGGRSGFFRIGRDAHELREDAVAATEKKRTAKLASIQKQVARIKALNFK